MIFIIPPIVFSPPAEYRPLGSEAEELRKSMEEIFEPVVAPLSERRKLEIRHHLRRAADQAVKSDGIFVWPGPYKNTSHFLESLPGELPLPVVVVEAHDKIGLDWDEGPDKFVSLTIYGSNQIGFSALLGSKAQYGRVNYFHGLSHTLPEKIRSFLQRVHPSAFH